MKSYPFFPARKEWDLDGIWDFAWLGNQISLTDFKPEKLKFDAKAAVPGVFDLGISHYGERGLGVYRTCFTAAGKKNLRLKLGGMGLAGRLFVDRKEIGKCALPYTPLEFDFNLKNSKDHRAEHELLIAVDNRFDSQKLFRDFYDFYGFGGIYRSVTLQELPDFRIERAQVFTAGSAGLETGKIKIRILTGGKEPADQRLDFTLGFDGKAQDHFSRKIKNSCVELTVNVPDFQVWTPENPHLHLLKISTGDDLIIERFGIRTIEAKKRALYLNGKKLFLSGVNRHETHPEAGPVQTYQSLLEDAALIRGAGLNFVRCVHYPQDPAWLDLCDETGLLLWVESLGWGLQCENDLTKDLLPAIHEENRIMIRNGINHPAVIIWGMLNECASNRKESKNFYRPLLQGMKQEDASRLRSYASCQGTADVCFDEADLISLNAYPGWCSDIQDARTPAANLIGPHLKRLADFYSKPEFDGKPILMSEIGVCALRGFRDRASAPWSEEFQSEYILEAVKQITADPRFSGYALWQFCDSRSFQTGQVRVKPRGFNCAGLVDEYRRPKMAYDTLAEFNLTSGKSGKRP